MKYFFRVSGSVLSHDARGMRINGTTIWIWKSEITIRSLHKMVILHFFTEISECLQIFHCNSDKRDQKSIERCLGSRQHRHYTVICCSPSAQHCVWHILLRVCAAPTKYTFHPFIKPHSYNHYTSANPIYQNSIKFRKQKSTSSFPRRTAM